ncbi:MAG: hypothetical protein FGM28_11155 [Limnohabitans sp.]|nr:hypothetical protein [Limnohabitans sp.]
MSTLSQPFSLLQWCPTRQAWGWAVLVLCLGLLGGCGGGGGGSATNAAPTPLSLDLQPSAGLTTTITAGTTLVLVPTYPSSVSSAVLKWNDGTAKSTAVSASGAPVTIGSSLASSAIPYVFTLEVTYQDPTVLRPSLLTQTQTLSVTVNPAPAAKLLTTGSLITGRSDFTATMLTNGTLLVAGGVSSTGTVLKSAEIYDPVTGKWTATGEMKSARRGHAASLLPDGRVLVSGGFDGTTAVTALNKADIYDPATGIWSATGTLIQARRGHTSTLLNNKKVLIVGGNVSSGNGTFAELYDADPGSDTFGTFIETEANLLPRQGHTATLLWDGRVLIAGRSNADGVTLCANDDNIPVACSSPSYNKNIDSGRTTEIYDPSATQNLWSYGPTMAHARYNHTSTTMGTARRLLILGGFGSGASTGEVIIVPDALATTTANLVLKSVTGLNLVKPVAYHNTLYLPASSDNASPFQFLVVGGYNLGDGSLSILQRFTITESSGTFSSNATSTNSLQLNTPRAMHTSARLNNGSVVILGNYYTSTGTVTGTVEIWSP